MPRAKTQKKVQNSGKNGVVGKSSSAVLENENSDGGDGVENVASPLVKPKKAAGKKQKSPKRVEVKKSRSNQANGGNNGQDVESEVQDSEAKEVTKGRKRTAAKVNDEVPAVPLKKEKKVVEPKKRGKNKNSENAVDSDIEPRNDTHNPPAVEVKSKVSRTSKDKKNKIDSNAVAEKPKRGKKNEIISNVAEPVASPEKTKKAETKQKGSKAKKEKSIAEIATNNGGNGSQTEIKTTVAKKTDAKQKVTKAKKDSNAEITKSVPENGTPAKATQKATAKGKASNAKKVNNINDAIAKDATQNGVNTEKKPEAKSVRSTGGRKRAALVENDAADDAAESSKSKKPLLNPTKTLYNEADFYLSSKITENFKRLSGNGEQHFLKISSWNVAGLRSWLKKEGLKYLDYEEPDIFCIQETKCTIDQMPEEVARIPGYHPYYIGKPGGYAGVALYSKIMPINVEYGIGDKEFDSAGRLIAAEYEKFFLINVYVPNSGRKLVNLEARMRWEKLFQAFVKQLDNRKPVIICGDMNCSHNAIDLANPKSNTRSAGFTQEERDKFTELLSLGFIDTFRHLYPNQTGAYTYWTYMSNARARNVGWRLDYFLVSERVVERVLENAIRSQCKGSDHCPITLFIDF